MSGIEAAFFGVICRDSELRTAKSGAPFLQFTVRVGDDDPTFACVRSSRSNTLDRAARFVTGSSVFCEGRLFLNMKTAADGSSRVVVDLSARYVRIVDLARHATRDGAAAVDPGEAA